jgi:asparagine synthase (glutamine-hydrolysing)
MLQAEYARLYEPCLADSTLVEDRILDGAAIAALVREHATKKVDHGNRLWLLINAELWYRMAIRGHSKQTIRATLRAAEPRVQHAAQA